MTGQIIEIAEDGHHLSTERGFLIVRKDKAEKGRIPFDGIMAVIGSARRLSYSHNVLLQLSERGLPFVICARDYNPKGILWPLIGNHRQSRIMESQMHISKPNAKRIWTALVKSKLQQQAAALDAAGLNSHAVESLIKRVKSGDPDNVEAWAAQRYWKRLMGENFRRDRAAEDINRMLNYGYTVLRAAMARAIAGAGLHPSIGVHHSNPKNAMPLVDDMMEPFRPLVDLQAWHANDIGCNQLNASIKRRFVSLLHLELPAKSGDTSTISRHMQRLATSIAGIALGEQNRPELPLPALPLILKHWLDDNPNYEP